jgi:hypothetical protein
MGWNSEIDQINAASNGIIRVGDETASDKELGQQALVDGFRQALSNETPLEGEDKGWVMIGGVALNQTFWVKDVNGTPLFEVTIKPTAAAPHEYLSRILPVLLKRSPDGDLMRLTFRFDDDTMTTSNQPTNEQMAWLMGQMGKVRWLGK